MHEKSSGCDLSTNIVVNFNQLQLTIILLRMWRKKDPLLKFLDSLKTSFYFDVIKELMSENYFGIFT